MSSCPARTGRGAAMPHPPPPPRSDHRATLRGQLMVTILHLITGLETGGAEGMLARLVTRTDRSRFRSVVVSMTDEGTLGPIIAEAGIALETLGIGRGTIDPRGVTRLIGLVRRYRPDIVQTWLYHADL